MELTVIRDGNVLTLKFGTRSEELAAAIGNKLSYMYRTRDFRGNLKVERLSLIHI